MSDADYLRETAQMMRDSANAATPGPWASYGRPHGGPRICNFDGEGVAKGYATLDVWLPARSLDARSRRRTRLPR